MSTRIVDVPQSEWMGPHNEARRAAKLEEVRELARNNPGTVYTIRMVADGLKLKVATIVANARRATHTTRRWP